MALINGTSGDESLTGTNDADTIYGSGNDTINGLDGNDTYIVDNTNVQIIESSNSGSGTDTVQARVSYTLGDNFENLELTGSLTQLIDGYTVYGNPVEWGKYLDYYQGDNTQKNLGSCFPVALENYFIESGMLEPRTNYNPPRSGKDQLESLFVKIKDLRLSGNLNVGNLMSGFGKVESEVDPVYASKTIDPDSFMKEYEDVYLDDVADYVKDGRCVIVSCDANVLWGRSNKFKGQNHAVVITGVAYDGTDIAGFYICDGGRRKKSDASRFVSYDLMNRAFAKPGEGGIIITSDIPFKQYIDDIDGTGNELDNLLIGNSGKNKLWGMDGDDTLNGAGGADTLYGGVGDDFYYINDKDIVVEAPGEGRDTVYLITNNSYSLAANVEKLYLDAAVGVKLNGNSENNTIYGSSGNDTICGNDGNDVLSGGGNDTDEAGTDKIYGGRGNDILSCGMGKDSLYGGPDDDMYFLNDIKTRIIENPQEGNDSVLSTVIPVLK